MSDNTAQHDQEQNQENVESEDNTQVADAGVPGQIQYPDREVDAERAAAFAAGKVDTLYPEDEDGDDRRPGDETGEETEPAAFTGEDPNSDRG